MSCTPLLELPVSLSPTHLHPDIGAGSSHAEMCEDFMALLPSDWHGECPIQRTNVLVGTHPCSAAEVLMEHGRGGCLSFAVHNSRVVLEGNEEDEDEQGVECGCASLGVLSV